MANSKPARLNPRRYWPGTASGVSRIARRFFERFHHSFRYKLLLLVLLPLVIFIPLISTATAAPTFW